MAFMANDTLQSLLYGYAKRCDAVYAVLDDFLEYVHKYSKKYVGEKPELVNYLSITESDLLKQLDALQQENVVFLINKNTPKSIIAVLDYYSAPFAARFDNILRARGEPFPSTRDLPKQIPFTAFARRDAKEFILELLEAQSLESRKVYCVSFPNNLTPLLFPVCVPVMTLVRGSVFKISDLIKREEYHDYYMKKLKMTNPNKEITTRNFYDRLCAVGDILEDIFHDEEESYYNWGQLCYFIKEDFEKNQDPSPFDISILQAVYIAQVWALSLKDKRLQNQKEEEAKNALELCFRKPPYFFEMEDILHFKDDSGDTLFKTLGKDGLQEALDHLTTDSENNLLPKILTATIDSGRRYYIHKVNVMPLIIRLANEAHTKVFNYLTDAWYKALMKNQHLPEMKEQRPFEHALERCVRRFSPLLYALLNSSFLPVLNVDLQQEDVENKNIKFNIYLGNKLQPLSEILMLQRDYIMRAAKELLPWWWNIPIINVIVKIFIQSKPEKTNEDKAKEEEAKLNGDSLHGKVKQLSDSASEVAESLIPEGSNLERELNSYIDQWNKIITKDVRQNLINDVNSLIRDYLHSVKSLLRGGRFTADRIDSLARTLYNSPNMRRINGGDALLMYIKLYMLKLIIRG